MVRVMVRLVAAALLAVGLALQFMVVQVVTVGFVDPVLTPTMAGRMVEAARGGELPWLSHRSPSLDALGPHVPRAVLAAEDARFFLHDGFDWASICDALAHNRESRRLRGASTISQQTAKNLFLWQGRSWVRKGLEVVYTALLEALLSKERILELYLGIAETGPLVFGLEAGARHHFGVPASALDADQAARLAAILPDPRHRSVDGAAARERAAWVRAHPAPWPGDKLWDVISREWAEQVHGPWECL